MFTEGIKQGFLKAVYKNIHQEIIDRCKLGDRNAQMQLYKLYYKAMYNTSLRIVNNQMEAEDIMQESFLTAFQKIAGYKGDAAFGAWLKRIVINNSLDSIKKADVLNFSEEIGEEFLNVEAEVEENNNQTLNVKQIQKSIDRLPAGYRVIVSLYLLEGYDHEEIAQVLKISSSTSRSQYNRGKNKLKELLSTESWVRN